MLCPDELSDLLPSQQALTCTQHFQADLRGLHSTHMAAGKWWRGHWDFTEGCQGELNGQKLHANTWMLAVTGHSTDCRGSLRHSPEPAHTGYLHPVHTTLSALVQTADSALSFLHYPGAPSMQKQENTNNYLQDLYTAFITGFSPGCITFGKKKNLKNPFDTDVVYSFIKARVHTEFSSSSKDRRGEFVLELHSVGSRSARLCWTEVAISL